MIRLDPELDNYERWCTVDFGELLVSEFARCSEDFEMSLHLQYILELFWIKTLSVRACSYVVESKLVSNNFAGKKLAESIIKERLAACVNRVPGNFLWFC